MEYRFRHLAGVTTALTFALILLGVYTAAAGAGLSCGARWPLCDGWLGLFPANWISFIEWFHRLVAMVTGFFILGTTYAAWRHRADRRMRRATAAATLLLPLQILLGGGTVLIYGPAVQVAHHGTALLIFAALVATTVWAFEAADGDAVESGADATASEPARL